MKAADKAYSLVKEGILTGSYRPGMRITEQEVVTLSGVSRTPVREALRRLEADGLVTCEPNVGVVVCEFSPDEADDIFGLRVLLESYCARLAAERVTPEETAQLRRLAEQHLRVATRPKPDLGRIAKLNAEFHAAMYKASGNARLASMLTMLIEPTLVLRTFQYYTRDAVMRSAKEHLELVDMFAAGYADGAEALMRSHVLAARFEYRKHHPLG